jgi:hypothetical protein
LTAPVVSYDRLTGPCWLKLTRRGSEVTGLISTNGLVWIAVGSASVEMGRSALIGLLFASGLSNQTTTVQMDQVSVK